MGHMHATAETVDEVFDLFDKSYLLVVPAGHMRGGYDVLVAFNGNRKRNFDSRDDAIEYAQDYAHHQQMDGVLALHPPAEES